MVSDGDYFSVKAAGVFVLVGCPVAAPVYWFLAKLAEAKPNAPISAITSEAWLMSFVGDHVIDTYFLWLVPMLLACWLYVLSRRKFRSRGLRLFAAAFAGTLALFLLRVLIGFTIHGNSTYDWKYSAPDIGHAMVAGCLSAFVCAVIAEGFFAISPET
jgi:F0F1-type ATP synthase membrane subunit a